MTAGSVLAAESLRFTDAATGRPVLRITSHPSTHHHNFFLVPSYTADMAHRLFVSHRHGFPALFMADLATDELVQCTDRRDLNPWSVHPGRKGRFAGYTAGTSGYRLDLDSLEETEIVRFDAVSMRAPGMVSGGMGTTALSHDDRWWAVRANTADGPSLVVVDLRRGTDETVLRAPTIGHLQFCPRDAGLLSYAGDPRERLWLVGRDGGGNRRLYRQRPMQWVTHEVWLPDGRELAFVDWPHAVRAVDAATGSVRTLAEFNAWHAAPSPDGRWMVADTVHPDVGLQLFPVRGGPARLTVCTSGASSIGEHRKDPFPYADGQVSVYALQHTHPHPSFSPDGRRILFTSDRTGHSQIYQVEIEPAAELPPAAMQ